MNSKIYQILKKLIKRFYRQINLRSKKPVNFELGYKTLNTKFKIAVVGLGKQGTKLCKHLCYMNYNVVAVCDISTKKNYNKIKKIFPKVKFVKKVKDLKELNIDICVVATLASGKLGIIKEIYNLGISKLLIEKPITNTIKDTINLKNFIKKNDVKIQVFHPFLFSDQCNIFKEKIKSLDKGKFVKANLLFKPSGLGNIGSHVLSTFLFLTDIKISKVLNSTLIKNKRKIRGSSFNDPNAIATVETKAEKKIYIDNTSIDLLSTNIFIEYENLNINIFNNEKMVIKFKKKKNKDLMFLAKNPINTLLGKYRCLDNALTSLIQNNFDSLTFAFLSVEIIIASHICFEESSQVDLPLNNISKSYYNFS